MNVLPDIGVLEQGGVVLWMIAALSVFGLATVFWIAARLVTMGAWGGAGAEDAVRAYEVSGATAIGKGGLRSRVVAHAVTQLTDARRSRDDAREEAERMARRALADARRGLRVLDVIVTIAPLLGLLGTVIGMIAAFQALQQSGSQADPSILAGGIWEALLTTAAGMAVAIPAALAHAWFDGVVDRVAIDLEDLLTRLFLARPDSLARAAE